MLTKSVLLRMKRNLLVVATAAGGLLSGDGVSAEPEPVPPPVAPAPVPALSAEQLQTFNENLPLYLAADSVKSPEAWTKLRALGIGALPLIEAEFKKINEADLYKLRRLARWIKAGGDPCLGCGKG